MKTRLEVKLMEEPLASLMEIVLMPEAFKSIFILPARATSDFVTPSILATLFRHQQSQLIPCINFSFRDVM
jgi:hypothetical protein